MKLLHFLSALLIISAIAAGPQWKFVMPVLESGKADTFDETAVKDPSIVRFQDKWHLFYTARGLNKYSIGYVAAPEWKDLNQAHRFPLPQLSGGEPVFAAPQAFFFRPKQEWFLIYQTTGSNYQPVYSHTKTIEKPESWSAPKPLAVKDEKAKWIDFWVICDGTTAWLFYTRDHRDVYAMTTTLAAFPQGFGEPRKVFSGVHEAVHIYLAKSPRPNAKFAMLFETSREGGWRQYGLASAPDLGGPWSLIDGDFASSMNSEWSRDISHGELLRTGYDERLEADLVNMQFLIQGMPAAEHKGNYPDLRWRLGLIRNY